MHTLTLNIKDNAYSSILYFLKNLSTDVEILSDKINTSNSSKKSTSLKGAFSKYSDISKINLENNISQKIIIDSYEKENSWLVLIQIILFAI